MPAASMMWVEARAVKVTGLCPRVGERTYGGRSDLPVSAALAALANIRDSGPRLGRHAFADLGVFDSAGPKCVLASTLASVRPSVQLDAAGARLARFRS